MFYRDWETMNDWHKPALDGIGYQDSLNGERAWWTDYLSDGPMLTKTAAGKTVAWINYMTNVNRTFGNFAPEMPESFMVLNVSIKDLERQIANVKRSKTEVLRKLAAKEFERFYRDW